jgi:signal transduction histidine kinase
LELESLHDRAIRIARKLGLRLAVGLSLLILAVSSYALYSSCIGIADSAVGGQTANFSFWAQVNDRFQIQRTLSGLVGHDHLAAAQVVDSSNAELGFKGSEILHEAFTTNQAWIFSKASIVVMRSYPLVQAEGTESHINGFLRAAVEIPVYYLVILALIQIMMTWLVVRILEGQMVTFASSFTVPVRDFANLADQAKDVYDLRQAIPAETSFREINLLGKKIREMATRLVAQTAAVQEAEKTKELVALSTQVAHDIRSPVLALRHASRNAKDLDNERKSLILLACDRIEGIAEDLLERNRQRRSGEHSFEIGQACADLLREKKDILLDQSVTADLQLDPGVRGLRVKGDSDDFKRILSNLINNSVEAFAATGSKIQIHAITSSENLKLVVEDDGPGIPDEVLARLANGQSPTTKSTGNAIGLAHAKSMMTSWGGTLTIRPKSPRGTEVEMTFVLSK